MAKEGFIEVPIPEYIKFLETEARVNVLLDICSHEEVFVDIKTLLQVLGAKKDE